VVRAEVPDVVVEVSATRDTVVYGLIIQEGVGIISSYGRRVVGLETIEYMVSRISDKLVWEIVVVVGVDVDVECVSWGVGQGRSGW
jgi:hypothetical protein